MEGFYRECKFFRFCAVLNVLDLPAAQKNKRSWQVYSILFLDYDRRDFVRESFIAMFYSKGGLTAEYLERIPFDFFQEYVKEGFRIQKESEKESNNFG